MHILLTHVMDLLAGVRAELDSGLDISPAMRFRIETLLNEALAKNIDQNEIQAAVEELLLKHGVLKFEKDGDRVIAVLALWQQRAPVVPSTN